MPIHIPPVMSPMVWTQRSWDAYVVLHKSEMEFLRAYRDTIGIFALFSRKKAKRLKEAKAAWRESRAEYYKVVSESEW